MSKPMDHDFSLEAVPQANRNGFLKMFVLMLGFTFFSASMLAGGTLGQGLPFSHFIWAVLAGNLILGLYTGSLAYISAKTGLSTHLLTRYAFGEKGSYLSSFLLSITQIGWFGVGVVMFALPVQKVTGMNLWVLIILSGILMTATAYLGIRALTVLSFIAVPAIVVLGGASVFRAADTVGGIEGFMSYQPAETMSIAAALSVCIGSFVSGGTLTPDFARFSQTRKIAVVSTVIAFFIGNSLMFIFGAVGVIAVGQSDISEVMFTQGLIIPAIIVLGLNIWTTNDNSLYASGLGFSNITKLPKSKLVIFNGIIGTVFSLWLYENFIGWLSFLNLTLPPIGAILLSDYFFVNKGSYPNFKEKLFRAVNWNAITAWAAGVLCAALIPGVTPIYSLVGASLVYILLSFLIQPSPVVENSDEKAV